MSEGEGRTRRRLKVTVGSDVELEQIQWWEPGWIPRPGLTLLAGREGLGKSTIAAAWAAEETRRGGVVGYLHSEDSRSHVVAPRLVAADAVMSKVLFVDVAYGDDELGTAQMSLPGDLHLLDELVVDNSVTFLIFDAIKSFKDARVGQSDEEIRAAILEPLARLAHTRNVVVIGLVHFGKAQTRDTGRAILGSVAWSQVARSVIAVAADEDGRLVVTNTKANLSPVIRSENARIISKSLITKAGPSEVGVIEWLGASDSDARDFLIADDSAPREELDTKDYTGDLKASWLYEYLVAAATEEVDVRSKDAVAYGADLGHARRSVFRLFDKLVNAELAEVFHAGGFPRANYWRLADAGTTGDTAPARSDGGTTGTTGADLHKQGGTTGARDQALAPLDGTTDTTADDLRKQSAIDPADPPGSSVVPLPARVRTETPSPTDHPATCRYCHEALVWADDRRDGYHSGKSSCVKAHRAQKGTAPVTPARPTNCQICSVELPTSATGPLCDRCEDGVKPPDPRVLRVTRGGEALAAHRAAERLPGARNSSTQQTKNRTA